MRSNLNYPDSPCVRVVETIHGKRIVDSYRWLEDINSKETKNWIEKQNILTLNYLGEIKARPRIRKRIKELWDYKHYGVPIKKGGRYFFTCKDGLQNQGILYWMDSLDNEAQVLLDPNELSEDGTIALTGYAISKDGRFLAYGLSTAGSDWQEWKVRRVEDSQDLEDHLEWIKFLLEVSWVPNNEGFFYSRYDQPEKGSEYKATNYYQKLYYHRLGTSQADDGLIYERPDEK
ncbi:MAG: S9 family peptidase, partial [Deltaproteobacteria bacterium]|nr:S9 family peptidase [Deltaproteobacteria bacterium]